MSNEQSSAAQDGAPSGPSGIGVRPVVYGSTGAPAVLIDVKGSIYSLDTTAAQQLAATVGQAVVTATVLAAFRAWAATKADLTDEQRNDLLIKLNGILLEVQ